MNSLRYVATGLVVISAAFLSLNSILPPAMQSANTLTVNSGNDVDDGSCDAVHCSLREAIKASNSTAGTQTIRFALNAPYKITPAAALPAITAPATIDGSTQSGFNGTPIVELSGSSIPSNDIADGLRIQANHVTVRGLVINQFPSHGIHIQGEENVVEGCYVGMNAAGTEARPNQGSGIMIFKGEDNRIGGTTPAQRNVVSGNTMFGIAARYSTRNTIQGNYTGTNATGTVAIPNRQHGIYLESTTYTLIGGETRAAGNLASGNEHYGINVYADSDFNTVLNNYVGTDHTGTVAIPNRMGIVVWQASSNQIGKAGQGNLMSGNFQHGLHIGWGSDSFAGNAALNIVQGNRIGVTPSGDVLANGMDGVRIIGYQYSWDNNLIGGIEADEANIIANNGGSGISIERMSLGNNFRGNSIYNNSRLGIDIGTAGAVTLNDNGDLDDGANYNQNYPVLVGVTGDDQTTKITWTLNGRPLIEHRIDFFSNPNCNNAEGRDYLGSTVVTTDESGNAAMDSTLPISLPEGRGITATATDVQANTSEFSVCEAVVKHLPASPTLKMPTGTVREARPILTWAPEPTSFAYQLTVRDSSGNVLVEEWLSADKVCTSTTCAVRLQVRMVHNGVYTWSVKSRNAFGDSATASERTYKVDFRPLAVDQYNPHDSIYTRRPTFEFVRSPNASHYILEVHSSGSVIHTQNVDTFVACNPFNNRCYYTPSTDLPLGTHMWRVRAVNRYGNSSWSPLVPFTINPQAPTVQQIEPASGATVTTIEVTFRWQAMPNINEYELNIESLPSGSVLLRRITFTSSSCVNDVCSVVLPLDTGSYRWRIRYGRGAEPAEAWSPRIEFNVQLPVPNTPTAISPSGAISPHEPTFRWTPDPYATSYRIVIEGSRGTVIEVVPSQYHCDPTACSEALSDQSIPFPDQLTWRVQAINGSGESLYSASLTLITTGPVPPEPVSPSGTIATAYPEFVWNEVSGAASYELVIYSGGTWFASEQFWRPSDYCINGVCRRIFTPWGRPFEAGEYAWSVRAYLEGSDSTYYSLPMSFTVAPPKPATPTGIRPNGTIREDPVNFIWNAVPDADKYQVRIQRADGSYLTNFNVFSAATACQSGTCSGKVDLGYGKFFWQVRAISVQGGYGDWSDPLPMTIDTAPAAPVIRGPVGVIADSTPILEWNEVDGATRYRVVLLYWGKPIIHYDDYLAADICQSGVCSVQPEGILLNGTYTWQVNGINEYYQGFPCEIQTFTVRTVPNYYEPISPLGGAVGLHTPPLWWTHDPNATEYTVRITDAAGATVYQDIFETAEACIGEKCGIIFLKDILQTGDYHWQVQGTNLVGTGAWTSPTPFTIGEMTVNVLDDTDDTMCTPQHCSLREAITIANATTGSDHVRFNLPGSAPHTIRPTFALPTITAPIILDGWSQPDFSGTPVIELDGSQAGGPYVNGLTLAGGSSTVRGFIINRFTNNGIQLVGARINSVPVPNNSNVIQGNYIGTDMTGTLALPNRGGISALNESGANLIGGDTPEERNVVTTSYETGIQVGGASSTVQGNFVGTNAAGTGEVAANGYTINSNKTGIDVGGVNNLIGGDSPAERNLASGNGTGINVGGHSNRIYGNYTGTNITGTDSIPNGFGIWGGGMFNYIGGSQPGQGNLISGNSDYGMWIGGATLFIRGNWIGTDGTGERSMGSRAGIYIDSYFSSPHTYITFIGGSQPGEGNVISGNSKGIYLFRDSAAYFVQGNFIGTDPTGTKRVGNGDGIFVNQGFLLVGSDEEGSQNIIAYNNHGISINDGVEVAHNSIFGNADEGINIWPYNPTDPMDTDTGANEGQNYPILNDAVTNGSRVQVQGTINTNPEDFYKLRFYASPVCDAAGNGEGQRYIGMTLVKTDTRGDASFNAIFDEHVPVGWVITATATSEKGSTSEFSICKQTRSGDPNAPTPTPTPTPLHTPTPTVTPTITPTPTATGTQLPASGITRYEVATGTGVNTTTVTTSPIGAANGYIYMVAVATKPARAITQISGLGLTWTAVRSQCSGRGQTRIEIWRGQNAEATSGNVTVTLAGTAESAVISVTRYQGVDLAAPVNAVASANTLGIGGACTGGTDSAAYSLPLNVPSDSLVFSAASMRSMYHQVSFGFNEFIEQRAGTGGSTVGLAVQDGNFATGTMTIAGTFSATTDWAVAAVALRPLGSAPATSTPTTVPTQTPTATPTATTVVPTQTPTITPTQPPTATPTPTVPPPAGAISDRETVTGSSVSAISVSTRDQVQVETGNVYLAAISTRPARPATELSGLGLTWQRVRTQCSGRNQVLIEVWRGTGTPTSASTVTATFSSLPQAAVIAVSRFSGVDLANPIGANAGQNTLGRNDPLCAGGVDSNAYTVTLGMENGEVAYSTAAMRLNTHQPGTGFTEMTDLRDGSGGGAAGLAVQMAAGVTPSMNVQGTISSSTDWAVIALALRPIGGATATPTSTHLPTEAPTATATLTVEPTLTPTATPTLPAESPTPTETAAPTETPTTTPTLMPSPTPTATLTVTPVVFGGIQYHGTVSGSSTSAASVQTLSGSPADADILFVAAIVTRPYRAVTSISGLGLTWTRIIAQCSGRNQTGVELWEAHGTPLNSDPVEASLISTSEAAVMTVSRYTGVDLADPIGASSTANTIGADAASLCSGGTDSASYSLTLTTADAGSIIYSAAAIRHRAHNQGTGYEELAQIAEGTGGYVAGLAVQHTDAPDAADHIVDGTFSGIVDWSVAAIELRAAEDVSGASASTETPTPEGGQGSTQPISLVGVVLFSLIVVLSVSGLIFANNRQ